MNTLNTLYEQYYQLQDRIEDAANKHFSTDLLQYGISREYYELVDKAAGLLVNFYAKYLSDETVLKAVNVHLHDDRDPGHAFALRGANLFFHRISLPVS